MKFVNIKYSASNEVTKDSIMKTLFIIIFTTLAFGTGIAQNNKLNINVDERVELMTTIQLICNSSVMTLTGADIRYTKEVTERFGKYVNHPAVVTFDSIYLKYFNFEMPFQYILHYSLPDFKITAPIVATEFAPERKYEDNEDTLNLFIKRLKDFYTETDFHSFFSAHKSFYDSLRNDVVSTLENKNIIPVLEQYYGKTFTGYNLILSPLSLDGGFGITIKNNDESYVNAIIGPVYTSKDYPEFKKSKTVVIHELSHSFSNPVIDSCWSSIKNDTCLYRPVIKDMQKEGYWGWKAVVYETFDRGNEVFLTSQIIGEAEGKQLYDEYLSKRYIYLPLCTGVLEKYKADRNKYKSITDVKPLLIKAFEDEKNNACH